MCSTGTPTGLLHAWIAPLPLQAESIGAALCELGIGAVITAALYLMAVALVYMSLGDLFSGFKNRQSKSPKSKGQAGNDFGSAGFKFVGAVIIGGFPILASAVGVSILDCVDPIRIITG